jgi:hypothetical protein
MLAPRGIVTRQLVCEKRRECLREPADLTRTPADYALRTHELARGRVVVDVVTRWR